MMTDPERKAMKRALAALRERVRGESIAAKRMARACKPPKRIEPKRGELWPQN